MERYLEFYDSDNYHRHNYYLTEEIKYELESINKCHFQQFVNIELTVLKLKDVVDYYYEGEIHTKFQCKIIGILNRYFNNIQSLDLNKIGILTELTNFMYCDVDLQLIITYIAYLYLEPNCIKLPKIISSSNNQIFNGQTVIFEVENLDSLEYIEIYNKCVKINNFKTTILNDSQVEVFFTVNRQFLTKYINVNFLVLPIGKHNLTRVNKNITLKFIPNRNPVGPIITDVEPKTINFGGIIKVTGNNLTLVDIVLFKFKNGSTAFSTNSIIEVEHEELTISLYTQTDTQALDGQILEIVALNNDFPEVNAHVELKIQSSTGPFVITSYSIKNTCNLLYQLTLNGSNLQNVGYAKLIANSDGKTWYYAEQGLSYDNTQSTWTLNFKNNDIFYTGLGGKYKLEIGNSSGYIYEYNDITIKSC